MAFYDDKKFHAACCKCADCGTTLGLLTYREAADGTPLCKIHVLYRKKDSSSNDSASSLPTTAVPALSTVTARTQQWRERERAAAEQREKERRELELIEAERRLRKELQRREREGKGRQEEAVTEAQGAAVLVWFVW